MNTLRTGQAEEGGSNESGQVDSSGESSEGEETDDDYKSAAPDSEDDSNDVFLAFIASDEWPATTRSGRAVPMVLLLLKEQNPKVFGKRE